MNWEHGRELSSMSDGTNSLAFIYDENNIRMYKYVNDDIYTYYYDGDKLMLMTAPDYSMYFSYDADGRPYSCNYNGLQLYYVLNAQGDVVRMVDGNGISYGIYIYDAWGNLLYETNNVYTKNNPLRYRGYVYDEETGLYYCQSRYYDPKIGRFINADSLVSTGQGIMGNNMFAYCGNNPVIRADYGGQFWDYVLDIGFLAWSIVDVVNDPSDWKNWVALVVDVVFAVIPFVPSGGGQVIKVGNKIDNTLDIANSLNKMDNLQDMKKVTMIGRNMDRVTNTAKLIGKADNLYDVWKGYDRVSSASKFLANAMSAAHNGAWLFGKLRQGYTVVDIGLSTSHVGRGLWYGTERMVLSLWETRNIWKSFINIIS